MLVRKLLVVAALIGTVTITGRTLAQDQPRDAAIVDRTYPQDQTAEPEKPKSLVERFDAFRKKIADGIFPPKKKQPMPSETSEPSENPREIGRAPERIRASCLAAICCPTLPAASPPGRVPAAFWRSRSRQRPPTTIVL